MSKHKIVLAKAASIGDAFPPDLKIIIKGQPPVSNALDDIAMLEDFYRSQAAALVKALTETLPGGTMHQLTIALLESKLSLLKIADANFERICINGQLLNACKRAVDAAPRWLTNADDCNLWVALVNAVSKAEGEVE